MNFWKSIFGRKATPAAPSDPIPVVSRANLFHFQKQPENVRDWRGVLMSQLGRNVMGVLFAHVPNGYPVRGGAITDIQAAVELGRIQGYMDCINLIRLMATHPQEAPPEIAQDYGAEIFVEQEQLNPKEHYAGPDTTTE